VSFTNATTLYKQVCYSKSALTNTAHTVTIEVVGPGNVHIDAVDVAGTLDTAVVKTRFEQTDAKIGWTGAWTVSTNASHSGGSAKYSGTAGAKTTIAFTGTAIDLIGAKTAASGTARISLDGAAPETVSFTNATTLYKQVCYAKSGLADTSHTVVVEVIGPGNVHVDAVDVAGTLQTAP
jgi:hypothetical protein